MQSEADGIPDSTEAPEPNKNECAVSLFCFSERINSSNLSVSIYIP